MTLNCFNAFFHPLKVATILSYSITIIVLNAVDNFVSEPSLSSDTFSICQLSSLHFLFKLSESCTHSLLHMAHTLLFDYRIFVSKFCSHGFSHSTKRTTVTISDKSCILEMQLLYTSAKHFYCCRSLHVLRAGRMVNVAICMAGFPSFVFLRISVHMLTSSTLIANKRFDLIIQNFSSCH